MNESLHALSGAYVLDALDDDERRVFEEHLPGCVDCRAEVASLREAAALMADDAALTPPPSLRANVLSGIANIRPLPPETPADAPVAEPAPPSTVVPLAPRRRHWSARVGAGIAAAAAVAAVGVGVVWQPWQQDDTTTQVATAADRVLAADDARHVSIEFTDGSSATVVRSLSEGKAVLVTRNMAAPPPGKAFEVWLQDDKGAMLPAGLMKRAGDNKVLLEGDAVRATGVGITVEPESGSPAPTSEPIALFDFAKAEA